MFRLTQIGIVLVLINKILAEGDVVYGPKRQNETIYDSLKENGDPFETNYRDQPVGLSTSTENQKSSSSKSPVEEDPIINEDERPTASNPTTGSIISTTKPFDGTRPADKTIDEEEQELSQLGASTNPSSDATSETKIVDKEEQKLSQQDVSEKTSSRSNPFIINNQQTGQSRSQGSKEHITESAAQEGTLSLNSADQEEGTLSSNNGNGTFHGHLTKEANSTNGESTTQSDTQTDSASQTYFSNLLSWISEYTKTIGMDFTDKESFWGYEYNLGYFKINNGVLVVVLTILAAVSLYYFITAVSQSEKLYYNRDEAGKTLSKLILAISNFFGAVKRKIAEPFKKVRHVGDTKKGSLIREKRKFPEDSDEYLDEGY
ncbi:uncharacterized protein VICG_00460 [Vittaforma corneae ATCC 50505]|uniref:Uncharacterized protein n=1 Tax=Vittaforma corneae (strain ATCC 50505) TaxID=993615 RepID=L2GPW1_VITCO|nr:uncharacterized protein VICG_00460 [Vittaforma corneae ATCC 50505]ELA42362.1 hypothetical protein VICG_00460 [Vittaforma corneae ATCC 50505]